MKQARPALCRKGEKQLAGKGTDWHVCTFPAFLCLNCADICPKRMDGREHDVNCMISGLLCCQGIAIQGGTAACATLGKHRLQRIGSKGILCGSVISLLGIIGIFCAYQNLLTTSKSEKVNPSLPITFYISLLLSEKLYPHLFATDQAANKRLEQLLPPMIKAAGITEQLKVTGQMRL